MPSPLAGANLPADRRVRPWVRAGLALLAVWSGLLALAVVLWLDLAFLPAEDEDVPGYLAVLGAPFVLVALGLLWWAWRSARALLAGRREGWTMLLVVGGVAVVQAVMTAPGVVAASAGPGTPGAGDAGGPPREVLAGLLAAIGLGLATLVVAVLGRRARAPVDAGSHADAE